MAPTKAKSAPEGKRYRTYEEFEKAVFPRTYRERHGAAPVSPGRKVATEILRGFKKHLS